MLWIDKYQPRSLSQLTASPDLTTILKALAASRDLPHLILFGPSGGGKRTRAMALLREMYGPDIDKLKVEQFSPQGVTSEFHSLSSRHHHSISVAQLGTKDRICVQYMIKQLAQNATPSMFIVNPNTPTYRVFVLSEAERLTIEAQAALRRTLEKCAANSRVILICDRLAPIIGPLKSRCLCLRVPLPTEFEVFECLREISTGEALNVRDAYLEEIARRSKRDLRRAMLMLEQAAVGGFPPPISVELVAWQEVIRDMVQRLAKSQTPKVLQELREMTYDVLAVCIPGDVILEELVRFMFIELPTALRLAIASAASQFSHSMVAGQKEIYHIEAFLAEVMCALKRANLKK